MIAVLFLILGNIRAAIVTACVIPLSMLFTITGMVETRVSANLMSLGAIDFGIIVDGAVIIVENCLRLLADRAAPEGRSACRCGSACRPSSKARGEVIKPSLFGTLIIAVVYLPVLTLTGRRRQDVHADGADGADGAAGAAIFSMTFVPAAVAIFVTGKVLREGELLHAGAPSGCTCRCSAARSDYPVRVVVVAVAIVVASGIAATRMGGEFIPSLDEGDIAVAAIRIPGTSLTQSVDLQAALEKRVRQIRRSEGFFRTHRHRRGRDRPDAALDIGRLRHAEAARGMAGSGAGPSPTWSRRSSMPPTRFPGSSYEISQPIQLRVNELISGVRSDVGIKIFGDDLDILQGAAKQVEAAIHGIRGASGRED